MLAVTAWFLEMTSPAELRPSWSAQVGVVVARVAREHGGTARIKERPGGGNAIYLTFAA